MLSIRVGLEQAKLEELRADLGGSAKDLPKALVAAVNDTTKTQVVKIARGIRERVNIKKKDIDPHIRRTHAGLPSASARILIDESERIGLKYFGAKQTKRGVTYRIAKTGGRGRIEQAFGPEITRLGGQVFRRVGKARLPIVKLFGPSPWGVFVKAGMPESTQAEAQALLEKNVGRRVNLILLRRAGKVK